MRQVQKGKIISPEARRKMAQAKLGKPWSEAMRAKMVGRKTSPEVVAKIVAKTKGLKRTPEQITRITEGRRLAGGWKHSEESKAKMREGHKGKQLTAEHRAKIGLANKLYQQALKEKQAYAT
jgi:hypothetical protein